MSATSEPGGRPRVPPGTQLSLFDADAPEGRYSEVPPPADADAAARAYAVDPRHNVVLEASAGTGKTSVLVSRYINLLRSGVDPANILAITFTRKAAGEMRERIVRELRAAGERSEIDRTRWLELRDRLDDIAISTIDAFCLSLLREFPLEADVDPGFDLADETEVPRLVSAALDRTLRILVALSQHDADVSLVLAQLGIARTRDGLATLLDRRLVAWSALNRFLVRGPRDLTAGGICRDAAAALHDALASVTGGLAQFLDDGPAGHPRYRLFRREVEQLMAIAGGEVASDARIRGVLDRVGAHLLTHEGKARKPGGTIAPYTAEHYGSRDGQKRHRDAVFALAPRVEAVMAAFNRNLNVVLARGVKRMFAVAMEQYRRALDERSVLDYSDVLQRAVELLRQMDEFSQSRYRLESRYHHVLVDEFQDTSRAQWELISLLVQAWGQGAGLAANPSIFIVGDRKQSIYRFRDAEVAVLEEAAGYIEGLRAGARTRHAIARSFRASPELLHFTNDLFTEISHPGTLPGEFTYQDKDRFPVDVAPALDGGREPPALGLAVADSPEASAEAVADEIDRLLRDGSVRDKATGLPRPMRAGDIAVLFRSRTSHREFEQALGARAIPTYVYKGLGFFDADEIKDLTALLRYLADPTSNLRAAAFLRSRFVRLSDAALAALAPEIAAGLLSDAPVAALDAEDRATLEHVRPWVRHWLDAVDRVTPAELLDRVLAESAYAYELRGLRRRQAWENVKKLRGLLRRIQNRGYATLSRIANHLDALTAGDESNAVLEALEAVNLMTVHASKGLEFPVVFMVNVAKGASAPPRPIRISAEGQGMDDDAASVSVGPFVSDTDERERERERHETRRLLYVGVTRARDRLYFAAALRDGRFVPGRGSLAEVLPESFKTLLGRAAGAFPEMDAVGWTGVSGREYVWRLCRRGGEVSPARDEPEAESAGAAAAFDSPALPLGVPRVPVSAWIRDDAQAAAGQGGHGDRLVGVLVHRLFEAMQYRHDEPDRAALASLSLRLLRPDELAGVAEPPALAARAADAWLAARARPDVAALLDGSQVLHEVPFSMHVNADGRPHIMRGTIDCVVLHADGRATVVEFKTGRPRDAHRRQLDAYVEALRELGRTRALAGVAANGDTGPAAGGDAEHPPEVAGVLVYL